MMCLHFHQQLKADENAGLCSISKESLHTSRLKQRGINMFICQPCLLSKNPDLAKTIPETNYYTTDCEVCKKPKQKCTVIAKEAIDPKAKPPASKPQSKPDYTKPKPAKTKYEYLIVDWESPELDLLDPFTTKKDLLAGIQHHVFELGHQDIDVYKLTAVSHKAEIKVEVGEK